MNIFQDGGLAKRSGLLYNDTNISSKKERRDYVIAFVRGELAGVTESSVIIDCAGIGYEVIVPGTVLSRLPQTGSMVKLHTYLQVREDGVSLFGFADREELLVFRLLIGVNGIGPKAAVAILSSLSADDLRFAVLAEDEKTLAKAPGIGAKTAKKLILELKDKFRLEDAFEKKLSAGLKQEDSSRGVQEQIVLEAIEALTALGFSGTDASRAVNGVEIHEGMNTDDVLKQALKHIRS